MTRSKIPRTLTFLLIFICLQVDGYGYDLEKKVEKYTLGNGIRVLLLERHMSPTVSFYIRQRVGSVDEPDGKSGMAHFLEHMMFKGTKTIGTRDFSKEQVILKKIGAVGNSLDAETRKGKNADALIMRKFSDELAALQKEHSKLIISNEIDRLYTENGGLDLNASTGQDITTFHVSLPSNKVDLWAKIESDRIMNPVFREFYIERDVIMEERRQRIESRPEGKLAEAFYSLAFTKHPYGRPIIGWPSDLQHIGMDDLYNFQKIASDPEKTVIAVVGDINPLSVMNVINEHFSSIPKRQSPSVKIETEPEQTQERRRELLIDSNPRIIMGYHKPTAPSRDDYIFDAIESIMGRGRTSRLYKELVLKRRIAEAVSTSAGSPGSRYPNLFVFYATPRHPHEIAEVEKAINDEIEKIRTEPITDIEMQKVKNRLKADFLRTLLTNSGIASALSYYETLMDDYRYLSRYNEVIDTITPSDVLRVAGKYLRSSNRSVVILRKPSNAKGNSIK